MVTDTEDRWWWGWKMRSNSGNVQDRWCWGWNMRSNSGESSQLSLQSEKRWITFVQLINCLDTVTVCQPWAVVSSISTLIVNMVIYQSRHTLWWALVHWGPVAGSLVKHDQRKLMDLFPRIHPQEQRSLLSEWNFISSRIPLPSLIWKIRVSYWPFQQAHLIITIALSSHHKEFSTSFWPIIDIVVKLYHLGLTLQITVSYTYRTATWYQIMLGHRQPWCW